ncbi:MAG: FlgD immunoglobulin-like domain containing protein [bacterium]
MIRSRQTSIPSMRALVMLLALLLFSMPGNAQELLVVFAANLDNSGGVNPQDNSGADLYSVRFDPDSESVSGLQRLTSTETAAELFPSLSPDMNWVAYNQKTGNRNEIRLHHLETGRDTSIFTAGRFPEWVDADELLVTYVAHDTQDVFLLELNLSGESPVVLNKKQITDRTRCPGTSKASDGFAYAGGSQLVFHVWRASGESGAAMAMINMDGTGFRRLTDWNGSGHGIAAADGGYVVSSSSQTGRAVLLHVQSDTVLFGELSLPSAGSDLAVYDSRFAQVPKGSYAYQAWGADERALFHSVRGTNSNMGVALSRLLYTVFDESWQLQKIVDFSTLVETLAGKSGRDFSTASAGVLTPASVDSGVVYVTLAMHNEDYHSRNYSDYRTDRQAYLESRQALLDFCRMLHRNNVPFNWESDWTFLLGVLNWDSGNVLDSTGGKTLLRYLKEDLNISIDPHSHESDDYNYADVACLIDSLGVTPTNVVGGHIWDPNDPGFSDWERFRTDLAGSHFPWYSWKGDILMGNASTHHQNDPEPSGVWRPKDKDHFWQDDSAGNVCAVGQYKSRNGIPEIQSLIDLYKSGTVSPDSILTATIMTPQHGLDSFFISDFEKNTIQPLLEMQARGEIKLVTFGQLIDDWQTKYGAAAHLWMQGGATAVEESGFASGAPEHVTLLQNYPNPFNPETAIWYTLPPPHAGIPFVQLKIYNLRGQVVRTLVSEFQRAGDHSVVWDGRDDRGQAVASGVYLYRLKSGQQIRTRRMVLLR